MSEKKKQFLGQLVRAGDLFFEGDFVSTPGLLIAMSRDELRTALSLPIFSPVVVIAREDYEAMCAELAAARLQGAFK